MPASQRWMAPGHLGIEAARCLNIILILVKTTYTFLKVTSTRLDKGQQMYCDFSQSVKRFFKVFFLFH